MERMNTCINEYRDYQEDRGYNRRHYPRIPFQTELQFLSKNDMLVASNKGVFHNISPGGALFQSEETPPLSAVILIATDLNDLSKCLDIDDLVLAHQHWVMGKVVRVLRNKDQDTSLIGLQFIAPGQEVREDVQQAMKYFDPVIALSEDVPL